MIELLILPPEENEFQHQSYFSSVDVSAYRSHRIKLAREIGCPRRKVYVGNMLLNNMEQGGRKIGSLIDVLRVIDERFLWSRDD